MVCLSFCLFTVWTEDDWLQKHAGATLGEGKTAQGEPEKSGDAPAEEEDTDVVKVRVFERQNLKTLQLCNSIVLLLLCFFFMQKVETNEKIRGKNPQVYMDITIGNKSAGRIVMLLRADAVPRTAGLSLRKNIAASFQESDIDS